LINEGLHDTKTSEIQQKPNRTTETKKYKISLNEIEELLKLQELNPTSVVVLEESENNNIHFLSSLSLGDLQKIFSTVQEVMKLKSAKKLDFSDESTVEEFIQETSFKLNGMEFLKEYTDPSISTYSSITKKNSSIEITQPYNQNQLAQEVFANFQDENKTLVTAIKFGEDRIIIELTTEGEKNRQTVINNLETAFEIIGDEYKILPEKSVGSPRGEKFNQETINSRTT
jgi:HD-GYP domain-containing protein (c-di-GMP phosphodiesterase class II)